MFFGLNYLDIFYCELCREFVNIKLDKIFDFRFDLCSCGYWCGCWFFCRGLDFVELLCGF